MNGKIFSSIRQIGSLIVGFLSLVACATQNDSFAEIRDTDEKLRPLQMEEQGLISGLWVWERSAFITPKARKTLLGFCKEYNFNHLALHLQFDDEREPKEGKTHTLSDTEALSALLEDANQAQITVVALRGDPYMAYAENQQRTLDDLATIVAFNNQQPPNARFIGVRYDIEPYLTPEWQAAGQTRAKVIQDYLTFLVQARALLDKTGEGMTLAVDIPFWWDIDELRTSFNGQEKPLTEHIQDITHYVVLMSYRRYHDEVLRLISEEALYAEKIDKVIYAALETGELKGTEAAITFYGYPKEHFLKTKRELDQLFSVRKSVGGVVVHHYGSLYPYLKEKDSGS